MPYIDLNRRSKHRTYTDKRDNANHQAVYNTQRWRELRLTKLIASPLCEICSTAEKPVLANQVHHKIPISAGQTTEEKQQLGFNYQNLQSLCTACHNDQHHKCNWW